MINSYKCEINQKILEKIGYNRTMFKIIYGRKRKEVISKAITELNVIGGTPLLSKYSSIKARSCEKALFLWLYQWYHLFLLTFPSLPKFHCSLPISIQLSLHILHVDYIAVSIIYPLFVQGIGVLWVCMCNHSRKKCLRGELYLCETHLWVVRTVHMTMNDSVSFFTFTFAFSAKTTNTFCRWVSCKAAFTYTICSWSSLPNFTISSSCYCSKSNWPDRKSGSIFHLHQIKIIWRQRWHMSSTQMLNQIWLSDLMIFWKRTCHKVVQCSSKSLLLKLE